MPWWKVALILATVAVVVGLLVTPFDLQAMTKTSRGKNEPSRPADIERLKWLQQRRDEVLNVLREKFPHVQMTSAYRNDEVNAAVGGSPTSRHRYGLAFDIAEPGRTDYAPLAAWLHENAGRLLVQPRDVLAETTPPHLHVDYFDPLGVLDKQGDNRPTAYKAETLGGSFTRLA